jgi:hypothetical protein
MITTADKQLPGLYRRRIGDALVTTINDGFLDIPLGILRGAPPQTLEDCMAQAFQPPAPRLTVNTFMVELDGRRILIDAGGGSTTIYSMGLMAENIATLGLTPADFDIVLLTHIHPDHSNGLLGDKGEAIFPRAEIILHQDDVTFWSDPSLKDGRSAAALPCSSRPMRGVSAPRPAARFCPASPCCLCPAIHPAIAATASIPPARR